MGSAHPANTRPAASSRSTPAATWSGGRSRCPTSWRTATASSPPQATCCFIGQPDGNLLCLDARTGRELWRWQTGAAISSSPIMYEVDGEQYLFTQKGEFFFNDSFSPRPTGKVEVY